MTDQNLSSESGEQIAVIQWCDLMRIPIIHIVNEGKRSVAYASMLKRMGLRKGFPDLFVPRPRGKYHGLFIEMKYGKNKTTEDQKHWLSILAAEGYACTVCYSAEAAIEIIKKYNKLKGGKMTEDRCACCGSPVPEGVQVCRSCVEESEKGAVYVEEEENRYF